MANLYEFTVGSSTPYRYTSGSKDVTISSNVYEAIAIERSEIFLDFSQDALTIKMQEDKEPASSLKKLDVTDRIRIIVKDLDSSNTILYEGYVESSQYHLKKGLIVLKCSRFPHAKGAAISRQISPNCSFSWGQAFAQADLTAGGAANLTAGSSVITAATGDFSTVSLNDMLWIDGAAYKVFELTSSSSIKVRRVPTDNGTAQYARASASGASWYNVTSLKGCPVNREDFKFNQTGMASSSDWTFTVANGVSKVLTYSGSGSPSLFDTTTGVFDYKYGRAILKKADGTILSQNYIRDVSSTTISFMKPIPDSDASIIDEIIAYQGCNKKFETCRSKFNASPFYGGMPYWSRLTSGRVPDEYNAFKVDNRSVPEVIGRVWVTPKVFYVGPDFIEPNWASKRTSRAFGFVKGTEEWIDSYSVYTSMAYALATKVDLLFALKKEEDLLSSERSAMPTVDSSGSALSTTGDGEKFPIVTDSTFYTYPQTASDEDNSNVLNGKISSSSPRLTTINEDRGNSKVVWNPSIWGNPEYSYSVLTYNEFYSGENSVTSEVFEMVESYLSNTDRYQYPEIRYVGMSYFISGLTVAYFSNPYDGIPSEQDNSAQNAIQLGAYQGTYNEKVGVRWQPNTARKPTTAEIADKFVKLKALVFHAPKIAGTRSQKDYIAQRRTDVTINQTCTYTAGSTTVTFAEDRISGGTVRYRGAYKYFTNIAGTSTYTSDVPVDSYIRLEPVYTGSSPVAFSEPRVVTKVPSDTEVRVESKIHWDTPEVRDATARNSSIITFGAGNVYYPRETPAFTYRQDINVGDMIELDSHFYVIEEFTDYNEIRVSDPLLTSGSGATAYIAEAFGTNPVNAIYYMMTEMLGIPQTDIDNTSFEEARDQVYSEKLSVNFELESSAQTKSKIDTLLDLIAGVIYWNGSNAKYRIGLKRDTEYGTLGFNTIQKSYDTTNSKDFLVDYPTIDSLYTDVSLTFQKQNIAVQQGEAEEESDIVLNKTNELNAEALGQVKVKKLSNEFISNQDAALFYLALKSNEFLFSPIKVSFKVAVTDLDTIHIGCLVSYSDPSYDINFNAIRITKIAAFNEFSAEVSVEGITEYDINVANSGGWEAGPSFGLGDSAEISAIELIPEFYDSIGFFNSNALVNSEVAFIMSQYNSSSYNTNAANISYFDKSGDKLFAGQVGSVITGTLKGGRDYEGTVDTSGYSPTGFIDPNGFVVTLSETKDNIPTLTSDEYNYVAIISRRTDDLTNASDPVLENSDYEMIAFKSLSNITQPTETSTGEATISGVARNIMSNNYYQENPYTQGVDTNYESGKTNFTGQFKHSAGVNVYILASKSDLVGQRLEFESTYDSSNFQFSIDGLASTSNNTRRGKNEVEFEYDYREGSYAGTDAEMEGDNKAPFKMKNMFPLPPAKLMGYVYHRSSQEYFYILYWSPANIETGASWRPPSEVETFTYPDANTLIEFTDPDQGYAKSVLVKPEDSFQGATVDNIGLDGNIHNLINGEYIKGTAFNKEWSVIGGQITINDGGSSNIPIIQAYDFGNASVYIEDSLQKIDVTNHGVFVYRTNNDSLTFDVSHIRPNVNGNQSIKRRVVLDGSSLSNHTYTNLVIE